MSADERETTKLEVRPLSKQTIEYIKEIIESDGYLEPLQTALQEAAKEPAITLSRIFDLTPGRKVTVVHGIKKYTITVVKFEPPVLFGVDKYKRVVAFNLNKVTAVIQDAATVIAKVKGANAGSDQA